MCPFRVDLVARITRERRPYCTGSRYDSYIQNEDLRILMVVCPDRRGRHHNTNDRLQCRVRDI